MADDDRLERMRGMEQILKYGATKKEIKQVQDLVRKDGSPVNDDLYYEEIINGNRKAINASELVIRETISNPGLVLAYIGTSHPAFNVVFKYFVDDNYPNLKNKLLQL